MRIAIISDIHGNLVALEAVLNDLKTEHMDRIVCFSRLYPKKNGSDSASFVA